MADDDSISRGTMVMLVLLAGMMVVGLFSFMLLIDHGRDRIHEEPGSAKQDQELRSGQDLWRDPHASREYYPPTSQP